MNDPTIARTPAADCPACQEKRRHTTEEWQLYHPRRGNAPAAAAALGGKS